jgi:hypothetical protein
VAENLPGIAQWDQGDIELDVAGHWPAGPFDAAFTANTCHIMSWPQVEKMFAGVAKYRPLVFAVYGPFHYGGKATSASNARFDAMLRRDDPASGIRDFEAIVRLARQERLMLEEDNAMPANNRLLVFRHA